MNFLIGILLVIILILLIYNFVYISISDTSIDGTCNNQNYLISTMQQLNNQSQSQSPVSPLLSGSSKSSVYDNQPIYDYNKYFFLK